MRGGKRTGAGRKPGGANRSKAAIKAEAAAKAFRAAQREAARLAKEEEENRRAQARMGKAEKRAEKVTAEILPPIPDGFDCPPDIEPLDFLKGLMRDPRFPMGFRRDCAALALPYAHAKPILGLKDARNLAALEDEENNPIASALRA